MKQIPCRFYEYGKGVCKFEEDCLYSHENLFGEDEDVEIRDRTYKGNAIKIVSKKQTHKVNTYLITRLT